MLGTVVLADAYYAGWKCDVEDLKKGDRSTVKIRPSNSVFRGVDLPAGEYVLTFEYRPVRFRIGALLSVLAWIVVLTIVSPKVLRFSLRGKLVT